MRGRMVTPEGHSDVTSLVLSLTPRTHIKAKGTGVWDN